MLIALFTLLLLGGSSTALLEYIADTRDSVKTVMAKDERQKEALTILKAMKKRTNARNKHVKRASKELAKAFVDHDAAIEGVDAVWDGYFAEIGRYNHDMLDLRYELKEHINREEWEAIFSVD